jgi:hypothetical protein
LLMRSRISMRTPTQASGRPCATRARPARWPRTGRPGRARIRDAQREAVRRAFLTGVADDGRLDQRKAAVEQRIEGLLARFRGALAVHLGARRLGERAPVAALGRWPAPRAPASRDASRKRDATRPGLSRIEANGNCSTHGYRPPVHRQPVPVWSKSTTTLSVTG